MEEILAVVVIAAAALALCLFAALQVAHRVADHRIDRRLRAAVLSELDEAPTEMVIGPAVALAFVSQLPVLSVLLHGPHSAGPALILAAELVLAGAAMAYLAGGRATAGRIAGRYARSIASSRVGS